MQAGNRDTRLPVIAPISNGRTDPRHGRPASLPTPFALRRRVGSVFSLAAAAVLVLALAGGLVAIRFGMPGSDDGALRQHPGGAGVPGRHAARRSGRVPVGNPRRSRRPARQPRPSSPSPRTAPSGWRTATTTGSRSSPRTARSSRVWGTTGLRRGAVRLHRRRDCGGYDQGAIAFAPDGAFYVADPGNHRIQKFGPDRRFLLAWGSEGREPGQFITPIDLVVDGQGRVYVVDSYRNYSRRRGDRRRAGVRRRRPLPRRVGRAAAPNPGS